MNDPLNPPPPVHPKLPGAAGHPAQLSRERTRRTILRRLATVLAVAIAAFAFTIWVLVRHDPFGGASDENSAATGVVRAQLNALGRGELRAAYDMFSDHYRQQVPFEAFHELVATHWTMFRAREVKFESRESSHVRAVFDTHILAADGEHYLARFTVVEIEGSWWIDGVRWGLEPEPRHRFTTHLRLKFAARAFSVGWCSRSD